MAGSTQQQECFLVATDDNVDTITHRLLITPEFTAVGRSPATNIRDPCCSRSQSEKRRCDICLFINFSCAIFICSFGESKFFRYVCAHQKFRYK